MDKIKISEQVGKIISQAIKEILCTDCLPEKQKEECISTCHLIKAIDKAFIKLKQSGYIQEEKPELVEGDKGSAKTLEEFYKAYRSGFNPITGKQNLFSDLTDQMIWDAAIKSVTAHPDKI